MARIRRDAPPTHVLFADTSILWFEDKTPVVAPSFDKILAEHSNHVSIELKIPCVVKDELVFQQTTSAIKALDSADELLKKVSNITCSSVKANITPDRIRQLIIEKIEKWIKSKFATVIETPIERIDWKTVIGNAIWRKPPFSMDLKNTPTEKGFRDALILETLINYTITDKRNIRILFVCGDKLLKSTAKDRLKGDSRCTFYESIEELDSYLKLIKEQLTDDFISALLTKANSKFFVRGNKTTLYYSSGVKRSIEMKFADYVDDPSAIPDKHPTIQPKGIFAILSSDRYLKTNESTWRIVAPEFKEIKEHNKYLWRSIIKRYGLYQVQRSVYNLSTSAEQQTYRIVLLEFSVEWSSRVYKDGRFRDICLENISFHRHENISASPDNLQKYNLSIACGVEDTESS